MLTWSNVVGHMLASGADDGSLRAWDLRSFAAGQHLAEFKHHRWGCVDSKLHMSWS